MTDKIQADAPVSEVADRIIACICLPDSVEPIGSTGSVKGDIANILTDFKRAIELGRVPRPKESKVEDAEIARLVEEARAFIGTDYGYVRLEQMANALEQQQETRRKAESKCLPDDCAPMLKSAIEALDIYINQLRKQVEVARAALDVAVVTINGLVDQQAMPDDSYLPKLTVIETALTQLTTPTQSGEPSCWHCGVVLEPAGRPRCEACPDECDVEGCDALGCRGQDDNAKGGEPVHDWTWALAMMKAGKRVQRKAHHYSYWLALSSEGPIIGTFGTNASLHADDFDATDWQLALVDVPRLIYEDELPADITPAQYDAWYAQSKVIDGVRMGPNLVDVEDER